MLNVSDSLRFMKTRDFNVAKFYDCKTPSELSLAFDKLNKPVVLKINSLKYSHKTDVKGVALNVMSKSEANEEFKRMMKIAESVVLQDQVKGVELIIGLKNDETFGPIIMLGIGGVLVEIVKDVSFRACPITLDDAEDMINDLKARKILDGYRNYDKINKQLLKKLLVKLSTIAEKEKIGELDLNPVIFDKENYYIVDARIELLP
jgi:acyl-CoA synthetase (NDP forming)